jgi:hypothetical protein
LKGWVGEYFSSGERAFRSETQGKIHPGHREIGEMALTNFCFLINFLLGIRKISRGTALSVNSPSPQKEYENLI